MTMHPIIARRTAIASLFAILAPALSA